MTYERLDVPAETVVTRRGRTVSGPPAKVEGAIRIAEGELAPVRRRATAG